MKTRKYLSGQVASAEAGTLIVQATATEVAQFGVGAAVVAVERSRIGVPFNLSDPVFYNRAGEPIAVVQDFRTRPHPEQPHALQLILIAAGTVPVNFRVPETARSAELELFDGE